MRNITKKLIFFLAVLTIALGSVPINNIYAQEADTSTTSSSDSAVKCDQEFYSSNDILFYSPCATSCSDSGSAGNGNIDKVHGANNGEKIFNFWVDAGLTAQQAAGITGSMQHEGGFSPFRQEMSQAFPAGGWGIAQFTGGQRDAATAYVIKAIGADLFNQYYKNQYGGSASPIAGYIPAGVPTDVNDKFLLGELNYLLDHVKQLVPNSIRTGKLKADYGQTIPASTTLYDYLKTVTLAQDNAIAWTYLYEFPANIKSTAAKRGESAADVIKLFSAGQDISTTCGGTLGEGGMDLQTAIKFMDNYKNTPSNVQYIAGAGTDCPGGPLSNCVSFSVFFARKYTNLKESGAAGNGSTVVSHLISLNPTAKNGHSPQPYAIFSTPSGSQMCGSVKCGHTGVILGVDKARGVVIVGEAACGSPASWDTAREYPLSRFDSDAYTYIYTDGLLKGAVQ